MVKPEVSPSFNLLKKLFVKVPSVLNVKVVITGSIKTALPAPAKVGKGEYSYKNFNELTKNLGKGTTRVAKNGALLMAFTNASAKPFSGAEA